MPSAADGPEEVCVLVGAGTAQFAISGDDIYREQVVDGAPVLAGQPTLAQRAISAGRRSIIAFGLPAGDYVAVVNAEGYDLATEAFTLEDGETEINEVNLVSD